MHCIREEIYFQNEKKGKTEIKKNMKHFFEFYEKNQCNQMMAFLGFNFNNSKCDNK